MQQIAICYQMFKYLSFQFEGAEVAARSRQEHRKEIDVFVKRYILSVSILGDVLGLFLVSFGMGTSASSDLGFSPVNAPPGMARHSL